MSDGSFAMSHAELRARVIDLAGSMDLFVASFPDNDPRMPAGWPDMVIMGPGGILYRELKTEQDVLTSGQRLLGYVIQAGGGDWGLWRPRMLASGQVGRELQGVSSRSAAGGLRRPS